jgi:hypothetical protein
VAPHSGERLEIRFPVPFVVRVVPKADGHRREGVRHDEFADLVEYLAAVVVPGVDVHSE